MSFNQSGFNQTAFNRPTLADVLIEALWYGEGFVTANLVGIFHARVEIVGVGQTLFNLSSVRHISFEEWHSLSNASFLLGFDHRINGAWFGVGDLVINNESVKIFVMEFAGTLAPGERIALNTERFTLKKGGIDALHLFNGSFVDLKEGVNEIVIESNTSTRTLLVRVEHRDRWV